MSLARKSGDAVCGRIGDHGVAFFVDYQRSATRTRARLIELAARASTLARRFDLRLHVGIAQQADAASLPARYRAALGAAEEALSRGVGVVHAEARPEPSTKRLRELRRRLAESVGERPNLLSPRFERYIEAVLVTVDTDSNRRERTSRRARAPCGAAARHRRARSEKLRQSLRIGRTSGRGRSDRDRVGGALPPPRVGHRKRPSELASARQNRSTRRALSFIREHLSEPLASPGGARRRLCTGVLLQALQTRGRDHVRGPCPASPRRARQADADVRVTQRGARGQAQWFCRAQPLSARIQGGGRRDPARLPPQPASLNHFATPGGGPGQLLHRCDRVQSPPVAGSLCGESLHWAEFGRMNSNTEVPPSSSLPVNSEILSIVRKLLLDS